MSKMFYNNSYLTNINLDDNFRTDKVEDMSFMFYMSSSSKINTNNFVTSKVKNMSHMFYGCDRLTELNLSSFDTHLVYKCYNI